jgi:hypothetical protein
MIFVDASDQARIGLQLPGTPEDDLTLSHLEQSCQDIF